MLFFFFAPAALSTAAEKENNKRDAKGHVIDICWRPINEFVSADLSRYEAVNRALRFRSCWEKEKLDDDF